MLKNVNVLLVESNIDSYRLLSTLRISKKLQSILYKNDTGFFEQPIIIKVREIGLIFKKYNVTTKLIIITKHRHDNNLKIK